MMEEQLAKLVATGEKTQMEIIELQREIRSLTNVNQNMDAQISELQSSNGDLETKAATAEARCIVLEDQLNEKFDQLNH